MAHGITGKDGKVLFAASAVPGKLTGWEHHYMADKVEDTGCGDVWKSRKTTFLDWEATVDVRIPATAYTSEGSVLGTSIVTSLLVQQGDSTPFFAGSGIVDDILSTLKFDDIVAMKLKVIGDGTAPATV